ncbi:MAG: ComEA family DNA-binding protein [Patescibacteria group bacterium]
MDTERIKEFWYRHRMVVAGGIAVLTVAGGVVAARPPQDPLVLDALASPAPDTPAPAEDIVVDVQGAVAKPGVKRLPAGSLVANAIKAAGGFTQDADRPRISRELNQAEALKNHQKVYVPLVGDAVVLDSSAPAAGMSGGDGAPTAGGLVNLNTATLEELDTLPGVGEATAEKIIDYRDAFGPFGSVDELLEVSGIGEAKLEKLRERVTV